MWLSRRSFLSALSLYPAARLLGAQQSPPAQPNQTFSTDVNVVNLLATVRNKEGQIVKDLTKDDFQLFEEGLPQAIRYFSQESDLPLTLGLLIDTSGSQRNVLAAERRASYRFLEQVLREDRDTAFVIHFDFEAELLQDLTSSRKKLEAALNDLAVGQSGRRTGNSGGGYPGGPGGGYPGGRRGGRGGWGRGGRHGGGTVLYDAVYLAADEIMRKQKGRKALIILSDGVDNGSKLPLEEGVEAAQRADTLGFSILFADDEGYGFGGMRRGGMDRPDGKGVLKQISRQTGGRFFEVSQKRPIEKVFAEVEEELRNQYSIGYTPERSGAGAGYRHIQLTTKQKGLVVQAREGYYAS